MMMRVRSRHQPPGQPSCAAFKHATLLFICILSSSAVRAFVLPPQPPSRSTLPSLFPSKSSTSSSTTLIRSSSSTTSIDEKEEKRLQSLALLFPPTRRPTTLKWKGAGGIWVFEQPFYTTTDIKTRMSVLKFKDAVVIYSPIAATQECIAMVTEATGGKAPTHIIMQSDAVDHTIFLSGWKEAFPEAQVLAVAPTSPTDKKLVDPNSLSANLPADWTKKGGPLKAAVLDVSPFFTELVLLHEPSKTLLVADSIWRVVSDGFRPNVVANVGWELFGVQGRSQFPYWFYVPQRRRKQVQDFLEVVKGWDFKRVIPGHLDTIEEGEAAKDIFLASYDYIFR